MSMPMRKKKLAALIPIWARELKKRFTKETKIMIPAAKPRLKERYLMSGLGMKYETRLPMPVANPAKVVRAIAARISFVKAS